MLATATGSLPVGDGWAFEFKWDGVRALLDVTDRSARLSSRAGNDVTAGYPDVMAHAEGIDDVLLDGEIVAFVDGRPSFPALQTRMHVRGSADLARAMRAVPVNYVVFDVLRRFGVDLTTRPYTERRATLDRFLAEHVSADGTGFTASPSFDDGEATLSVAKAHGLEGVVAKRLTSVYRPGQRSDDWRKLRFVRSGEFVIIGWEGPIEHPATLSTLILAVTEEDGLRYVGRVGSGLGGRAGGRVRAMLTEQDSPAAPGVPRPERDRHRHWVEPTLVVDVEFTAFTPDGLRFPVYRGIRPDKSPAEARGDA